jgi:hypothetical protein
VIDHNALRKLTLQVERAALEQRHLRTLLASVAAALKDRRRELRNLKARMKMEPRWHD